VELPIRLQGNAAERRGARQRIVDLAPSFFTERGISDNILSSRPNQVSGGQKQRAAIMRSGVNQPAILLADQRTASLDESRKQEVLNLLLALRDAGHTVIVVSHDKVFYQTGRQLELSKGVLREIAPDVANVNQPEIATRSPAPGGKILYGWMPRA